MEGAVAGSWFTEKSCLWPGQAFSLEIEEVLHRSKSKFQDILVIKTKQHGNVLILDGIIQCSERDEYAYQEMISYLPLCIHPNPQRVLIIGGGDGGVAREVAKHPSVQDIFQVEIDDQVIEVSKRYLPFMAKGFDSPKLTLRIEDGFEYLKQKPDGLFDVIITDSSDPIGPATELFTEDYFKLLKSALRPEGVICSQGGTVWVDPNHVKESLIRCRRHFDSVKYATAAVPTYPTGQIGFVIGSIISNLDLTIPKKIFTEQELDGMKMRYYNADVHKASFVQPTFISKILYDKL